MENIINLDLVKQNSLNFDNKIDFELNKSKDAFSDVVREVIDKGADYAIKAMPINDSLKDILIDVKKAFKTKDFKNIVKTAIGSSLREGMEILNIPRNVISDVNKIKDIAFKGGLSGALSAGIDIVTKKYLKNNIFAPTINRFLNSIKDFVFSKTFKEKLDRGISNIFDRISKYKDVCKQWYQAYDKFNIDEMNIIAKKLKYTANKVSSNMDCLTENNIIQNMTSLINTKKEKLSKIQLQICNNL
ncbi:MAG: hypothetical protein RSB67_03545 [Clostridia bacterium]